jgi:hypothetical protein
MSYPTFSFTTTAEEVVTAFVHEIEGKNGYTEPTSVL